MPSVQAQAETGVRLVCCILPSCVTYSVMYQSTTHLPWGILDQWLRHDSSYGSLSRPLCHRSLQYQPPTVAYGRISPGMSFAEGCACIWIRLLCVTRMRVKDRQVGDGIPSGRGADAPEMHRKVRGEAWGLRSILRSLTFFENPENNLTTSSGLNYAIPV